jgi:hypothetical protein
MQGYKIMVKKRRINERFKAITSKIIIIIIERKTNRKWKRIFGKLNKLFNKLN